MKRLIVFLMVLYCCLLPGVVIPVEQRKLPEGHKGIASKYNGDIGIEKDPAVIFVENFEEGSLDKIKSRWDNVSNIKIMSLSRDVPSGSRGKYSLLMTHIGKKSTGGHLYRRILPGYEKVYLRMYVKFDKNCYPIHHFGTRIGGYNPSTPWPLGGAGLTPSGSKHFGVAVEPHGKRWVWDYYNYWCEMRGSPPNGKTWGNSFIRDPDLKVKKDKWICVEVMVKLNDIGDRNGELALWIDGKLVSHLGKGFPVGTWIWDKFCPGKKGKGIRWDNKVGGRVSIEGGKPFEGFMWRTVEALKINYIQIQLYITGAPRDYISRVWYDHVVVAKKYIGPIKRGAL